MMNLGSRQCAEGRLRSKADFTAEARAKLKGGRVPKKCGRGRDSARARVCPLSLTTCALCLL